MRNLKIQYILPLLLILVLPSVSFGQVMTVLGGNATASECYRNARLASLGARAGLSLKDPCDFALEKAPLTLKDKAATHVNRGIILTKGRKFEAAMKDFESAIALEFEAPEIYVNRGNVYFDTQNFMEAISDYDHALSLDVSQKHIAHVNRGMAYDHMGDAMMAEEDFRQAMEYQPQWVIAERLLTKLLEKQESEGSE